MSLLINTKIDRKLYESTAITDEYPDTRPIWNTLFFVALGYSTIKYQPMILPIFLGYEYLHPDSKDMKEYATGMLAGSAFHLFASRYAVDGEVPNFIKLKEMGLL